MASCLRPSILRTAGCIRCLPSVQAPRSAVVRLIRCTATQASDAFYTTEKKGSPDSMDFRIFMHQKGTLVSSWHDIPLHAGNGLMNFVCEIPKETSAKMECATDETRTPIKQDTKKGKLRFYPYNINWNYGFLPQTWEDPAHKNSECDAMGDNDPVDVVEIGSASCDMGGVYKVKPVGVYAMIDEGELDWKVICVRADDPKAALIHDVEDVEREYPGELKKVLEWFRDYKIPDGKPANKFGYNDKCLNREFTQGVIEETHGFWVRLRSGARENTEELSLI